MCKKLELSVGINNYFSMNLCLKKRNFYELIKKIIKLLCAQICSKITVNFFFHNVKETTAVLTYDTKSRAIFINERNKSYSKLIICTNLFFFFESF